VWDETFEVIPVSGRGVGSGVRTYVVVEGLTRGARRGCGMKRNGKESSHTRQRRDLSFCNGHHDQMRFAMHLDECIPGRTITIVAVVPPAMAELEGVHLLCVICRSGGHISGRVKVIHQRLFLCSWLGDSEWRWLGMTGLVGHCMGGISSIPQIVGRLASGGGLHTHRPRGGRMVAVLPCPCLRLNCFASD